MQKLCYTYICRLRKTLQDYWLQKILITQQVSKLAKR